MSYCACLAWAVWGREAFRAVAGFSRVWGDLDRQAELQIPNLSKSYTPALLSIFNLGLSWDIGEVGRELPLNIPNRVALLSDPAPFY